MLPSLLAHLRRGAARVVAFLRPVDESALPRAQLHLSRLTRAVALVSSTMVALGTIVDAVAGATSLQALTYPLVVLAGFAGCYFFSVTPLGRRKPQAGLFALATIAAASASFSALAGGSDVLPPGLESSGLVIPLVLSMIAPWRPSLSLALGLVVGLLHFAQLQLLGGTVPIPGYSFIISSMYACTAAVGNQVQRHLWQELDRARASLAAAEKVSAMGQMIAGIAHEVKTPLAAVLNELQSMDGLVSELKESVGHAGVESGDLREIVTELRASVELVTSSTSRAEQFLGAVRTRSTGAGSAPPGVFSVRAQVEAVATMLGHRARRASVALDFTRIDAALTLDGEVGKFEQIIINLIANAIEACDEGGGHRVQVEATRHGHMLELSVSDDGPGVPLELRELIFAPLFTTRGSSTGTGLGLYISRDLAEGAFGGRLTLDSTTRGARFVLSLPDGGAQVDLPAGARS